MQIPLICPTIFVEESNRVRHRCINNKICILNMFLCYKFTDNMQNADDMVFDQRVQNVTSDIHDNLRLCTGNI